MAHGINPRIVALAERRTTVAQLYLRRLTQVEIATQLGVHQATVSRDLAALQKEWIANRLHDLDRHKAEQLEAIALREREAWAEWERSKASSVVTTEADGETTTRTSTGTGDPRYLQVLEGCVEQRARILGLFIAPRELGLSEDAAREQRYLGLADRVIGRLLDGAVAPSVALPVIDIAPVVEPALPEATGGIDG
jgi:hypothetical protein